MKTQGEKMISGSKNENDLIFAESSLIAEVQIVLHAILESKGVSRVELARRMGKSEAYVSQMFSDCPRNFTLKTIARVCHLLGETPRFTTGIFEEILFNSRRDSESAANNTFAHNPTLRFFQQDNDYDTDSVINHECNDNDDEQTELAA